MKSLDKFKGCLLGGAAGAVLGYVVEFLDEPGIVKNTGKTAVKAVVE